MIIRLVQFLLILSLGWGAFAFGSTYDWASGPLAVACFVCGALAWRRAQALQAPVPLIAMALVAVAIGVQLVPLSSRVLAALSPNTVEVLKQFDLLFAANSGSHPLSINPPATWHALMLFLSMATLLIGLTKLLSLTGTRWLVASLTVMGVAMALVGIGFKAGGDPRLVYGFWKPQMPSTPFSPFVNRNHFAGWMLMVLPATVAFLCAGIARGLRHVKPTLRERLIWFGSAEASQLMLAAVASATMGLALVMTMSRSGMAAFAMSMGMTAAFVMRGVRARAGRSLAWVYLLCLMVLVVGWVGVDAVVTRFAQANWSEFNNRLGAWSDARGIAAHFPLAGTGLNTYSTATLFFQRHDLTLHYAQAHNDYLQLWAEGGFLLTIPAAILAATVVVLIRRRFREDERYSSAWWARAGAVAGLVSIALQETVEFSLQMPGNAAMFAVLCAIALHKAPPRR